MRINARTGKIKALAMQTDTARRLQTVHGVGLLTALAIEAFAPPEENYKCGRDFAAWLGLVPRQFSSGGKERLGRVSKAGQSTMAAIPPAACYVETAGLGGWEILGAYQFGVEYPCVIRGEGVGHAKDGRRVYFGERSRRPFGAWAERTVVPSTEVWDVPDNVDPAGTH